MSGVKVGEDAAVGVGVSVSVDVTVWEGSAVGDGIMVEVGVSLGWGDGDCSMRDVGVEGRIARVRVGRAIGEVGEKAVISCCVGVALAVDDALGISAAMVDVGVTEAGGLLE